MFNGFLVPSSGRIKKFVVLDTGIKINTSKDIDVLKYITEEVSFNNPFPLFTLVLIRKNEESVMLEHYIYISKHVEGKLK